MYVLGKKVAESRHALSKSTLANMPQQYFEIRSKKIQALRASKQPNPYPHKFLVNSKLESYIRDYAHLKKGETEPDKEIRMGLRVMTQRSASSSLHFYVCMYS
jgi:lysyl-tRNA synthetase class 2